MKIEASIDKFPSSEIVDKIFQDKTKEIISGVRLPEKVEKVSFWAELGKALKTVSEARREANEKSIKMILGETQDIHDVMIAREKAETLFQLFLEVRNRVVQAFENIMRMQF